MKNKSNMSYKQNLTSKKCLNCCKSGHFAKDCYLPKTSMGIICVRYPCPISMSSGSVGKFTFKKDELKFLLICRRNTAEYVEFIRGKYVPTNIGYVQEMINNMTDHECDELLKKTFFELWSEMWNKQHPETRDMDEYQHSERQFIELRKGIKINGVKHDLEMFVSKRTTKWLDPEWGFPKGKRNSTNESDLACAIREFSEETNYKKDEIIINSDLTTYIEQYKGSNGIIYKHIYYIAQIINNEPDDKIPKINETNHFQKTEISNIGWFTFTEAQQKIRGYHKEKLIVLKNAYDHIRRLFN